MQLTDLSPGPSTQPQQRSGSPLHPTPGLHGPFCIRSSFYLEMKQKKIEIVGFIRQMVSLLRSKCPAVTASASPGPSTSSPRGHPDLCWLPKHLCPCTASRWRHRVHPSSLTGFSSPPTAYSLCDLHSTLEASPKGLPWLRRGEPEFRLHLHTGWPGSAPTTPPATLWCPPSLESQLCRPGPLSLGPCSLYLSLPGKCPPTHLCSCSSHPVGWPPPSGATPIRCHTEPVTSWAVASGC